MKVFSKEKWLETANAQKEQKILSQREIDDACEIWVDEMDGKSVEELTKFLKVTTFALKDK